MAVAATGRAELVGRERELALLGEPLERISTGGTAMVLRGDAGIGKSALVAEITRHAAENGTRVLMTAGVQSEAHLAFAGLHSLLRPAFDRLERLPVPQRDAVSAAFGIRKHAAADRLLIALAALELLAELAAETPLLVVVEDAQWVDAATGDVLAFVARRIELEPIVLIFVVRDGLESRFDPLDLEELQIGPLDADSAAAVLDSVALDLAANVRTRVLEEAAGNPLALIELPRAIPEQYRDGWLLPEPLPMTHRLERAFSARVSELPPRTQTLLLLAAAHDGGDVAEIVAAGQALAPKIGKRAIGPAVAGGLLRLHADRLEFRHPLVRSAVYQSADREERRTVHAALAVALAEDPDRAVWHRAAAAAGPDKDLVGALEATSRRALRRGALPTAMAALERAAHLTADEQGRGARFLRTADLGMELGRPHVVERLLDAAEPLDLAPHDRSWLLWMREMLEPRWTGAARVPAFADLAVHLVRDGDDQRALEMLEGIAMRCWWGDPSPETRALVVRAAESLGLPPDEPRLLMVLARADPVGQGATVLERLSHLQPSGVTPRQSYDLTFTATAVWAEELAADFATAAVSGLRAQGRLGMLARTLVSEAWTSVHLGQWGTAAESAAEATALNRETGQLRWVVAARLAEAAVAASRGESEHAEAIVAESEGALLAAGANPLLALTQLVRGRSQLATGRPEVAYDELRRIFDPADPAHQAFTSAYAVVDLAEAAALTGNESEARGLLGGLEAIAEHSGGGLLRSSLLFARAVLSDDGEAERGLETALAADLAAYPFTRARLLLAHGIWLRRHRRAAASRQPLRTARATFEGLGAAPWAVRAGNELRASGESARPRKVELRRELTAQELQIARMAADGLTNREIGQRLFLSHRTVGAHLYNVFPKLGVTARGQLRRALEAAE